MKALDRFLDGLFGVHYFLFVGVAFMKEMAFDFARYGPLAFTRGAIREFHGFMVEKRVMRTDRDWDWSGSKAT